ncbi:MAG: sigma-70 family RNA polymerase sigma factor [Bacteroidota bacterium]
MFIYCGLNSFFVIFMLNLFSSSNDHALQEKIQQGNQRAIGALLNRHLEDALIYAGRFARVNPIHEPEDLVNQAFVKLIRNIETGTSIDQVGPYLRKSIYHLHLDDLRRNRLNTLYLEDLNDFIANFDEQSDDQPTESALLDILIKEVAQMREDQQLVFQLRVFDRRDFDYIARELHQEVHKVTNIYYNVVKTLKSRADKLYDNFLASA